MGRREETNLHGEQVLLPTAEQAPVEKARTAQGETKKQPRMQHADRRCAGPPVPGDDGCM